MSCTTGFGRCDYLDFLPKRPQGTTKILGTPAFAGTKTPTALKSLAKGATTNCAETPVNCPYISGLRAARTAGGWPTKHLPAGRRAGRSDWAKRRFRRQPFILLSFSSSKKLRKAQETQSYQGIQCIGHTDFNTSGTNGPRSLSRVKAGYTLAFAQRIAHTGLHAETGAFRTGPLSLPSDCFTRCGNPAWPGGRTANFAPLGSRSRVLPKASRPRWAA